MKVCISSLRVEETQMNHYVVIKYNGEQLSVPKEVAEFPEQDRK